MGTVRPGNLTKYWKITCDGIASHPGRVAILLKSLHATETGIHVAPAVMGY